MWILFCGTFKLGAILDAHVLHSASYTKSSSVHESKRHWCIPIVCEFRPVGACPEDWKEFSLRELWMSFEERQCVAELGMKIGILYLARWWHGWGRNHYERRRWTETSRSADSERKGGDGCTGWKWREMIEDSTIAAYYYRGSNLLLSFLFTHDSSTVFNV